MQHKIVIKGKDLAQTTWIQIFSRPIICPVILKNLCELCALAFYSKKWKNSNSAYIIA